MTLLLVIIYLAFISLGLPDSILGAAWPIMYADLNTTVAAAGIIALVISIGTVISSLASTKVIYLFGTGKIVAISVLLTALSLYGFTNAQSVFQLMLLSVPLGLGAGAIDAALNSFVAKNYQAKHMNYLHACWGIGATLGPMIMAMHLAQDQSWREGYKSIAYIQFALVFVLILALPLWSKLSKQLSCNSIDNHYVSNFAALSIRGVKLQLLLFFCYCALEASTGLWAASYLTIKWSTSTTDAAFWTAMFFLSITLGRFCSGFFTRFFTETLIIEAAVTCMLLGVLLLLSEYSLFLAKIGLVLIGLGCAPIYPNTLHLTSTRFNKSASQAIIGLTMACAYLGSTLMPSLMGLIANYSSFSAFPSVLLILSLAVGWASYRLKSLA